MPFRPGLPQASGRLWIARTQEPSPPDARNTACQSLYFPRGMPPAPTPLLGNWTFVPNRKHKSELKGRVCARRDFESWSRLSEQNLRVDKVERLPWLGRQAEWRLVEVGLI